MILQISEKCCFLFVGPQDHNSMTKLIGPISKSVGVLYITILIFTFRDNSIGVDFGSTGVDSGSTLAHGFMKNQKM